MRKEVGGILRLWTGQDYRLLGGKDEAKNRQLNKFDGGFTVYGPSHDPTDLSRHLRLV